MSPSNPTRCRLQVLKRMIKCCSMMNCHTQVRGHSSLPPAGAIRVKVHSICSSDPQVAVLCQFLREVDYMTAFKALQEQNR